MAWIVKHSAEQQIDRRAEPYMDSPLKDKIEKEIFPRYPNRQAALLPVLHEIQNQYDWIPYQAMEEVALFLQVTPAQVLDTVSFYEEFWTRPKGQYLIQVCQSITCELVGELDLLEHIQQKLGIGAGETTDDGRFTLMTVECLGSCGTAPCALINEELHEDLTGEQTDRVLDALE